MNWTVVAVVAAFALVVPLACVVAFMFGKRSASFSGKSAGKVNLEGLVWDFAIDIQPAPAAAFDDEQKVGSIAFFRPDSSGERAVAKDGAVAETSSPLRTIAARADLFAR